MDESVKDKTLLLLQVGLRDMCLTVTVYSFILPCDLFVQLTNSLQQKLDQVRNEKAELEKFIQNKKMSLEGTRD